MGNQIFISHATADDAVVKELREALEARGVAVWADSRELSGGEPLRARVHKAIERASQFLVVLGPKKLTDRKSLFAPPLLLSAARVRRRGCRLSGGWWRG
jgi:ABC-type sugar transport system ATPase subunit